LIERPGFASDELELARSLKDPLVLTVLEHVCTYDTDLENDVCFLIQMFYLAMSLPEVFGSALLPPHAKIIPSVMTNALFRRFPHHNHNDIRRTLSALRTYGVVGLPLKELNAIAHSFLAHELTSYRLYSMRNKQENDLMRHFGGTVSAWSLRNIVWDS